MPTGATVVEVKEVRLSGRRVAERVIILRTGPDTSGVVVTDFTFARDWRVVWRREGVNLQLRVLATGRLVSDDLEQVVIGSDSGAGAPLWFFVLGWRDGRPEVLLDWAQRPVSNGVLLIEDGALVVTGPAGATRYTWDGRQFIETSLSPTG